MIEVYLKIFKFTLHLIVNCTCDKHKKFCADNSEKSEADAEMQEASVMLDKDEIMKNISVDEEKYFRSESIEDAEEPIETEISKQAKKFSDELKEVDINGLYDIDENSELPRYGISSDVEIITDSYEKEQEDIIEGRV